MSKKNKNKSRGYSCRRDDCKNRVAYRKGLCGYHYWVSVAYNQKERIPLGKKVRFG